MYDEFADYLHNYAIWTASRAAQRGFTTTAKISKAINAAKLRHEIHDSDIQWTKDIFWERHQIWIEEMGISLRSSKVAEEKITYGRLAKVVAVYIKTSIILPNKGVGLLSGVAHPPIDRVLLKMKWATLKKNTFEALPAWTNLNKENYYKIINILIENDKPFWMIEKDWKPAEAEEE